MLDVTTPFVVEDVVLSTPQSIVVPEDAQQSPSSPPPQTLTSDDPNGPLVPAPSFIERVARRVSLIELCHPRPLLEGPQAQKKKRGSNGRIFNIHQVVQLGGGGAKCTAGCTLASDPRVGHGIP